MKTLTSDLLPRARKKLTIVKVTSATEEGIAKKSPAKGGTKRRAPRKFKPKPRVPLDLNAIPEEEEEEVAVKVVWKRAPRKKNAVSQNDSQCSKQSSAPKAPDPASALGVSGVPIGKPTNETTEGEKDSGDIVDISATDTQPENVTHLPGLTIAVEKGMAVNPTRRRGRPKKTVETVIQSQCSDVTSGDSEGILPPPKITRKRGPAKKKAGVVVDSQIEDPRDEFQGSAGVHLSPRGRLTLLEPQPKVVRQRAPWRKVGVHCNGHDGSGAEECVLHPHNESADQSQVTVGGALPKVGRKRGPKKKVLLDLNEPLHAPKSPKKTQRRKYVKKTIGKGSPAKNAVPVFQGLGPFLTALCASTGEQPHRDDGSVTAEIDPNAVRVEAANVVEAGYRSNHAANDVDNVPPSAASTSTNSEPVPVTVDGSVTAATLRGDGVPQCSAQGEDQPRTAPAGNCDDAVCGHAGIETQRTDEGKKGKKKKKDPRSIKPRDSRKKWGMSIKRGCMARFTVKILLHAPHIAEVCVIEAQHVNKAGVVVHGGMKLGDRGCFAARLSPTIRKFVDDCLHEGYTVHQIMKKHLKFLRKWEADGGVITRDLLITPKDVRNIARKHAKETYMLDENDAQSVRMWVQRNPDKVFHYTETNQSSPVQVEGQLNGDNIPFTIGIQTSWQRLMMAKHGHGGGISIDATFGTNDKKVFQYPIRMF